MRASEFDRYAERYPELLADPLRARFNSSGCFFHQRKRLLLHRFFAARGLSPKALDWLDVGCGRGDLLALAGGDFRRAAGCDPSRQMLAEVHGIEVRAQSPPERIPFPAASFDLVTAVCVFHHVPTENRQGLMDELRRVVRPNGVVCIIEHNPLNPVTRAIVRRSPIDAHASLLTASRTRRHLQIAGFTILTTKYFLYLPEHLFRRLGYLEEVVSQLPFGGQYAIFVMRPE